MKNNTTKPNISRTKLFKQVSGVLGSGEALKQLNIAYKSYDGQKYIRFDWNTVLDEAFDWEFTDQDSDYWLMLDDLLIEKGL